MRSKLGNNTAGVAVATIFGELIMVGLCLHLRTWERWGERAKATLSIFFGVTMLTVASEIVWKLVL